VAESTRLVDLVQLGVDDFLTDRSTEFAEIAPELVQFTDVASSFLSGGKRFRALFCYWGWQSVTAVAEGIDPLPDSTVAADLPGVVLACSALEMFHAAALVHDDIMDRSDTRRGAMSAHKRFEAIHVDQGFTGDAALYGQSSALLLGDLLLGWSDELFDTGTALLASAAAGRAGRAEFARMRTEVTAGQYLDILEENSWTRHPETDALGRAHRVIVYKSAKYSVEAPLAIGAALGGGSATQLAALREFGLPLGVAYQLRDDMLGVFGDPAVTGKPAGDDLREGKRTVLVALARQRLTGGTRTLFDELVGDPDLDQQQIDMLRTAIRDSGATEQMERMIDRNVATAVAAIRDAPLAPSARLQLLELADTVTRRVY